MVQKIQDINDIESADYTKKVEIYGQLLLARLQQEHPERRFSKVIEPGYFVKCQKHFLDPDFYDPSYWTDSHFYIVEEVKVPRKGLRRILFGATQKKLRVLVELQREDGDQSQDCRLIIRDSQLEASTKRIAAELDKQSGESYSPNIRWPYEERFLL